MDENNYDDDNTPLTEEEVRIELELLVLEGRVIKSWDFKGEAKYSFNYHYPLVFIADSCMN